MARLDNYNYMKILTDWVDKKDIFKKKFVWPRQMEIHLPSNKKIALSASILEIPVFKEMKFAYSFNLKLSILILKVLDKIVGNSFVCSFETKINIVFSGGSSNIFNILFDVLAIIFSGLQKITNLYPP